jgi:hypothetical protein
MVELAQFSVGIYIHSDDPSVMASFATRLPVCNMNSSLVHKSGRDKKITS